MENASKALIMAGGMLIGILIATLFVYEMIYFTSNAKVYYDEVEKTEVTRFNSTFEKYINKKEITAQDVVTLMGYVDEYNNQNEKTIRINAITNSNTELYLYINKKGKYANDNSNRNAEFLESCNKSEVLFVIHRFAFGSDGRINKIAIRYK